MYIVGLMCMKNAKRITPMKHMFDTSQFESFGIDQSEIKIVNISPPTIASSKCLTSCKASKEVEKISKLKDKVTLTQAKTTTYMVVSTLKKTNILEDQSVMEIFTLLENSLVLTKLWIYFALWWYEELNKI